MIEANELRIGNYVLIRGIVDKITEISISDSGTSKRQGFFNLDKGYVEPIPITPEVLERCGFEKDIRDGGYNEYDEIVYFFNGIDIYDKTESDCGFCYATYTKYENRGFKGGWQIKTLHQLQNFYFALTGEELNYTP